MHELYNRFITTSFYHSIKRAAKVGENHDSERVGSTQFFTAEAQMREGFCQLRISAHLQWKPSLNFQGLDLAIGSNKHKFFFNDGFLGRHPFWQGKPHYQVIRKLNGRLQDFRIEYNVVVVA